MKYSRAFLYSAAGMLAMAAVRNFALRMQESIQKELPPEGESSTEKPKIDSHGEPEEAGSELMDLTI